MFLPAPGLPNVIFGYNHHWWPNAPRPRNFAKDWIEFYQNTIVGPPAIWFPFSNFDPPPRPRNFAKDWIAASGNYYVETTTLSFFSNFDPAPRPHNFARDWISYSEIGFTIVPVNKIGITFTPFSPGQHAPNFSRDWVAYSGNEFVEAFPQIGIDFSKFDPPAPPHNFAKSWIEYSEFGFTIVPVNQIGIEFTPFALGRTAKLWSGQGPQWWPYYFNAPFKPSGRDTHDGGHLRRWPHPRRHPSVYSQEYYDRLKKKIEQRDDDVEEIIEEIKRQVPNLLIPINRLIPGVALPSLIQLPPYRPMPTLHMNPPPFHMATPEEIAMDDEMIIRMLLED